VFNSEQTPTGYSVDQDPWSMIEKSLLKVAATFIAAIIVFSIIITSCKRENEERIPRGFAFGIDVSENNGDIDWAKVAHQKKTNDPIRFVIIRSSMGKNGLDTCYARNYTEAKQQGFIVGTYHYYRPNENSNQQFENFKKVLKLERGDLMPVVDIEVNPKVQSMESMKIGLRNFVNLVEKEYGVKPIIYTKLSMWRDYLQNDFSDCLVWISAYSNYRREDDIVKNANIHQFSDRIRDIPGIPSKYVDGDDCRDLKPLIY